MLHQSCTQLRDSLARFHIAPNILLVSEHVHQKMLCGIEEYENLFEFISDPDHEKYEETMEWVDGAFDPEYFDKDKISFDDHDERLKIAFKQ